jgi:hypothetical protein
MKLWFHAALALLLFAGALHDVRANPPTYDFDSGAASAEVVDQVFADEGCEGVAKHFANNPIPINAIDAATGREIIGWSIHCPEEVVAAGGEQAGASSVRRIYRSFGYITVRYA